MKPVQITNKGFFGRLFCKHEYQWFKKPSDSPFANISGQECILVCPKCGKLNGEMFLEYEGNGYK